MIDLSSSPLGSGELATPGVTKVFYDQMPALISDGTAERYTGIVGEGLVVVHCHPDAEKPADQFMIARATDGTRAKSLDYFSTNPEGDEPLDDHTQIFLARILTEGITRPQAMFLPPGVGTPIGRVGKAADVFAGLNRLTTDGRHFTVQHHLAEGKEVTGYIALSADSGAKHGLRAVAGNTSFDAAEFNARLRTQNRP